MSKHPGVGEDQRNLRPLFSPKSRLVAAGLGGVFLAVTLPSGGVLAQQDPYLECADVKKSKRRLECYDTVLKAQHPEKFERMEAARKKEQLEDFGDPRPAFSKDSEKLQLLQVVIVGFSRTKLGKWVLTTDSGQIWLQVDNMNLSPRGPKRPINAKIKRGALGSFYLITEGTKRAIKVKRVK